jgi:Outer membrane protein beta-barrel domain
MRTSILFAAIALTATTAYADEVVVESGDTFWHGGRRGVIVGASIDGGDMGCETKSGEDCGGQKAAGGFSGHLGGMLTPRLALMGEVWAMGASENNVTNTQVMANLALRGWATRRFWLQGGLGFARNKVSYDAGSGVMATDESATVPAFMAAIGFELVHTHEFGLDLEARTGTGFYEGDARIYNGAIGVGASWF